MADIKRFEEESDDQIPGKLLAKKQDKQEWPEIVIPIHNNKIPAESFFSVGRNCPKCAGKLTGYEFNEETKTQHLKCSDCGIVVTAQEVNHDEYDQRFRRIEEDRILYYMQMRERQLAQRDKEKKKG